MDYVEETTQLYRQVPSPPLHIIHNPSQFYKWVEWAADYRSDSAVTGRISPIGQEFDMDTDIDSFIAYYDSYRSTTKG